MSQSHAVPTTDATWTAADEEAMAYEGGRTPALFKKLYLLWVDSIYRYLLHKTADRRAAEDLTSQVFLKAFEQLPRYRHRGHFAAWLFTIARNAARDHFRKSSRVVALDAAQELTLSSDPLDEVVATDEIRRLDSLIRALPEEELELIRLRYVAGLSHVEIGETVGRSEEAVRKSIVRLLARLRGHLEGNHG